MTLDSLRFKINTKTPLEFCFRGKTYVMTYGSDEAGDFIAFGRLYERPEQFYSTGALLNEAKVENSYLQEVIQDL